LEAPPLVGGVIHRQYRFSSCKNKQSLPFDFAIKINGDIRLVEYQGQQHYKLVTFGGSLAKAKMIFTQRQKHDTIKRNWCKTKNIPLLEIPYWEYDNIEKILKEFLQ